MDRERETPIWVFVAAGCGSLVVLSIVGVVLLGYMGYRWTREVESRLRDPAVRSRETLKILGCDRVPNGYHAGGGFSLPLVMDVAVLTDREPDAQGAVRGFDRRGFIYVRMLRFGPEQQQLRDFFEGKQDDPEALRATGIRLGRREVLRRGALDAQGARLLYVAQRGRLDAHETRIEALTTLILVECPDDEQWRLGIWFGPDPTVGRTQAEADLSGSPADEAAILAFMAHFSLCKD